MCPPAELIPKTQGDGAVAVFLRGRKLSPKVNTHITTGLHLRFVTRNLNSFRRNA